MAAIDLLVNSSNGKIIDVKAHPCVWGEKEGPPDFYLITINGPRNPRVMGDFGARYIKTPWKFDEKKLPPPFRAKLSEDGVLLAGNSLHKNRRSDINWKLFRKALINQSTGKPDESDL